MKFYNAPDYQPRLQKMVSILIPELKAVLPNSRIEHIGSSSIEGAISKGDLDIFVGVSKERFDESLETIKGLGFKIKEDTLRTDSLCMLTTILFNQDVAIQLVRDGSEFEDFLRFRDILNKRSDLVDEYNILKQECEGMEPSAYRAKKSLFIERVLNI
jgi:GrpB-like predicted nucleotidyltransferase (UPF0157 family)